MGSVGLVLADLPDRLDSEQVETAIVVALVVFAVVAVAILRTVQKAATRMLLLGILFVAGVGLWWQREELQDCRGQCTCRVFAQDVNVPDDIAGRPCPD